MHYILHQSIASDVCEVSCPQVSHNGVHAAAQARLVWTRLSCKGLRSLASSCVYCALAHSPSALAKLKVLPIKGSQITRGPSCRRAVPARGKLSSVRFQCVRFQCVIAWVSMFIVVKHVVFVASSGHSRMYCLYTAVFACCIILYYMHTTRYHAVLLKSISHYSLAQAIQERVTSWYRQAY